MLNHFKFPGGVARAMLALLCGVVLSPTSGATNQSPSTNRVLKFEASTEAEAIQWQRAARQKLFELLMGGAQPKRVPLAPATLQRIEAAAGGYTLEEITLQSRPNRRVHAWMAVPKQRHGKVGVVLALHGHGGNGEQVVRGQSLYWYGRAFAEQGCVVISPDIGQHTLQDTNWTLMGERVWDALRCVDYAVTRAEVDPERVIVAGLSLGGEAAMYVAALDERIKATASSGWLTTIDNMKRGHCPCWNFPGLEQHFDFADVFACVAPRPLLLEIGEKERAPGGFPVAIASKAFAEIQPAYRVFGAENRVALDVHPGGHVFHGQGFWQPAAQALGSAWPWIHARGERELLRRGEIARRCFARALGVLDGWWATRDAATGLFPRRTDQPVWAPADNAADMFPFLALTAHYLAADRLPGILETISKERALTTRFAGLPDWFSLTNRSFTYADTNITRLIFGAAEYCKDGLVPMTEAMGRGAWFDRMVELMDAIWAQSPVQTDFGKIPAADTEVNGDLLQALARLYGATREEKYFDWAALIVEAYCREVLPLNGGLPPHRWDFAQHRAVTDTLNLNDHGNEIVGGLAEIYVLASEWHPRKATSWREPLRNMFHRLLDNARNEDGLWCNLLEASSAKVLNRETPDTWGYALAAAVAFGRASDDERLVNAARDVLRRINQPRYWHWNGADSYADSLEGGIYLLNRFPTVEGFAWLEKVLPLFLGKQRDDGIVEGWYGDGNYARTALLVGLYYTQGVTCRPWRDDLRLGAMRDGDSLKLAVSAEKEWSGRIVFDTPRHRTNVGLPVNYPRLNEFPEWFTVESGAPYKLEVSGARARNVTGAELAEGIPLRVKSGGTTQVEVAAGR